MPTSTFFRLPEEKRLRLEQAAWEEFTRVSFPDASINQIIRTARIPRGSFYQYFSDKQELFVYLLSDMHEYFMGILVAILDQVQGDLFAMPLLAFDRFLDRDGDTAAGLSRCIQMLQVNRGMDMQWLFSDKPCVMPDGLFRHIAPGILAQEDEDFARHTLFLIGITLLTAIMETLSAPERRQEQQLALERRVEIIRRGSGRQHAQEGGRIC